MARETLTEPAIGPSWADLPFTLKVTPLGALDLTSKLAVSKKKTGQLQLAHNKEKIKQYMFTRADVVEVLVKELYSIKNRYISMVSLFATG